MARPLKTAKLIKSIKRKGMIPEDQGTFDTEDFLEMINEEIQMHALPHLLTVHEEYLVYSLDVAVEEGKQSYDIPYRAVGNKLRDVQFVDSNGEIIRELSRISLEQISDYRNGNNSSSTGLFYVQNNKIVLIGTAPQQNSSLRMFIYLSPSDLVEEDEVGVISAIDRVTGTISMSNFPTDFSAILEYDFVSCKNPNTLVSFNVDAVSTDATTKSIILDVDDISDDLKVGDYVCKVEETPVPQLPSELHPVLAQRVAIACLEALNDTEGISNAQRKLMESEKATWDLVDNRVEGANQKITARHGTLTQAVNSRFNNRSGLGNN